MFLNHEDDSIGAADQVTQGGSHVVENIGDNEVRVLQVEFKHE